MSSWESGEKKEDYRKLLCRAAYDISDRLLGWHERFGVPVVPRDLEEELPQFVTTDDLAASHIMTLYWSICMILSSVHHTLHRPDEHFEDRIVVEDCFRNIIRGVRLFVHPGAGMFRQHVAPFPISAALHYLKSIPQDKMLPERLSLGRDLNNPECIMIRDFILSMDPMHAPSITRFREEAHDGRQ